jgi:hypothetical protein
MPKTLSLKEIIGSNPSVDPKLLRQFRKALRKLRQAGLERKEYGLVSPINRHRATVTEDKTNDSRTIHLGSRH